MITWSSVLLSFSSFLYLISDTNFAQFWHTQLSTTTIISAYVYDYDYGSTSTIRPYSKMFIGGLNWDTTDGIYSLANNSLYTMLIS